MLYFLNTTSMKSPKKVYTSLASVKKPSPTVGLSSFLRLSTAFKTMSFLGAFAFLSVSQGVSSQTTELLDESEASTQRSQTIQTGNFGEGDYTLIKLQKDLKKREGKLKQLIDPTIAEYVFVIGPTGAGKSTCVNLIAGKPFEAREQKIKVTEIIDGEEVETEKKTGKLTLSTDDPLPGIKIGHRHQSQTLDPTLWKDTENKRIFIDFPGFGDSRGAQHDILTAFSLYSLITQAPKVKLLLTLAESCLDPQAARGIIALQSLGSVSDLFQDETDIQKALALLVTQQGRLEPCATLRSLIAYQDDIDEGVLPSAAKQRASEAVKALVDNPDRISSVPYPLQEGSFPFNPAKILKSLEVIEGVSKPKVNLRVNSESRLLAQGFAAVCNEEAKGILRVSVAPEIEKKCEGLIDQHQKSMRALKQDLSSFAQTLQTLREETVQSFMSDLEKFLQSLSLTLALDALKEKAAHIEFLKHIDSEISDQAGDWKSSLFEITGRITALATAPETIEKREFSENPWYVGDSGHGSRGDHWATEQRVITTFPVGSVVYGEWKPQGRTVVDGWERVSTVSRMLESWHHEKSFFEKVFGF